MICAQTLYHRPSTNKQAAWIYALPSMLFYINSSTADLSCQHADFDLPLEFFLRDLQHTK